MKSDLQFLSTLVYNNFPWPENSTAVQKQKIEVAAQAVLDTRAEFPDASLTDLSTPSTYRVNVSMGAQLVDRSPSTLDSGSLQFGGGRRRYCKKAGFVQ